MSERHTPGPWRIIRQRCLSLECKRLLTLDISHPLNSDGNVHRVIASICPAFSGETELTEEDWANARLIAAASDLLEALIAIIKAYSANPEESAKAEMEALALGIKAIRAAGVKSPPLIHKR